MHTLLFRRAYALEALALWGNHDVHISERLYNPRLDLDRIWRRGGEGIMLKRRKAAYGDKSAWIKVKKEESHDCLIVGFKDAKSVSKKVNGKESVTRLAANGWIGAVKLAQWKQGECKKTFVGYASGMDDATREDMTRHPKKYLNQPCEITCQLREPTGRFRHPRFVRMRPDKDPLGCVWEDV